METNRNSSRRRTYRPTLSLKHRPGTRRGSVKVPAIPQYSPHLVKDKDPRFGFDPGFDIPQELSIGDVKLVKYEFGEQCEHQYRQIVSTIARQGVKVMHVVYIPYCVSIRVCIILVIM